ncbi:hypothetical protein [Microseira wollei]|uniref:Uncharacterized protein n=1 Tax=Microseira wollei NIES-4236 TaxID=2530354 RepID=A0AAV3XLK8_9CYAN|nr:hypothetical protein [Microseira wollei]GET43817.1 hypothetical protein MiSe_86430 [Microseira wollei NIES-4236]
MVNQRGIAAETGFLIQRYLGRNPVSDLALLVSTFPEKTSGDSLVTLVKTIVGSGIKLKRDSNMNLSKLFSSVGLASMLAMTTIIASPKPKAASAQLAAENSVILVNPGETFDAEIPTADSLVVSHIPNQIVEEISSSAVWLADTLNATDLQPNFQQPLNSPTVAKESDGFKVAPTQEPEQKPAFSIRIKSPEEIFRSLSFYAFIGFVLLIAAIIFFVEILKFILWIILLPLKILLSLFR